MRIGGFRLGWLRRRWWVIAGSILLVTAVSLMLAKPAPTTYTGEAVLIVRSGATTNTPGSANEANRLAVTYSQLIPQDSQVLERVSRTLGIPRSDVEKAVTVSNDANTSILRVRYTTSDSQTAIDGARATADALAGPTPASSNFSGVGLSRLPDTATSNSPSNTTVPIGVILGICLGIVLVIAWERTDGRIDDLQDLEYEVDIPATSLEGLSAEAIVALLERWRSFVDVSPVNVAIVTPETNQRAMSAEVAMVFATTASGDVPVFDGDGRHPLKGITLHSTGAPATLEVGESVVQHADVTVLVVPVGTRVNSLRRSIESLADFGAKPSWALFASDRVLRRARRHHGAGEPLTIDVGTSAPSLTP